MLNVPLALALLIVLGLIVCAFAYATLALHVYIFGAKPYDEQAESYSTTQTFEAEHKSRWLLPHQRGTTLGRLGRIKKG